MLSNIMMQMGNNAGAQVEEAMFRHMVLNSLRSYKLKYGSEYGELVIACDNKNYWRRQIFPYYKANRKKNQDASQYNWKEIFECLNKFKQELKTHFPYRVIDCDTAEADDIIATLAKHYHQEQKIMILSGDKDFIQLQQYTNVQQYDPIRKKNITHSDPNMYRAEHILKGDAGDGIPNVLSGDNCFVVGERQKPLTQKKMQALLTATELPEHLMRNYMRNKQLIDLNMVPEQVTQAIIASYTSQADKKPQDLLSYFVAHKLKNLIESIQEFV